jgi:hypothetical protein
MFEGKSEKVYFDRFWCYNSSKTRLNHPLKAVIRDLSRFFFQFLAI